MRLIPKAQNGAPVWFTQQYPYQSLIDWNRQLDRSNSNLNLLDNGHSYGSNLDMVYQRNLAYTSRPDLVGLDIQAYYNLAGNGMSGEEFVNFYNNNANTLINYWNLPITYKVGDAGNHNRLFRQMFTNRSLIGTNAPYNIGYLSNLENINGSSTWLRRMDTYEKEFDQTNPDKSRIHEITLANGSKVKVYKNANGTIGLLSGTTTIPLINELELGLGKKWSPQPKNMPSYTGDSSYVLFPKSEKQTGTITAEHTDKYGFDWQGLGVKLRQALPSIISGVRLAGNLNNNERVYKEALKGIKPDLKQSYNVHRQIFGDEAGKQQYYTRATQIQTKSGLPVTSDAALQNALMFEGYAKGNELRAEGDRVDNAEIRRTSDESMQLGFGNIARDTEVANANIAALNQANREYRQLRAGKYSADWTSVDNYLKGWEQKFEDRNSELQAIQDKIWEYDQQEQLQNDPAYINAVAKWNNLARTLGANHPSTQLAQKEVIRLQRQHTKNALLNRQYTLPWLAKRGGKFNASESSENAVKHFREMYKLMLKKRKSPKVERLYPVKMQQGGVAPFTIYTPIGGSERVTSSRSSGSSKSHEKKDETLELIKSLFTNLKGLPVDVDKAAQNMLYLLALQEMFGGDTSSLATMYLQQMLELSKLEFSRDNYDKALAKASSNEAIDEYAVTPTGKYIVQDYKTGSIKAVDLDELGEGNTPLSNYQLLMHRAYNQTLSGSLGDVLLEAVASGVGIEKIGLTLKNLLPSLGSDEKVIEGYSRDLARQISAGIKLLSELPDSPDGIYKLSSKTLEQQVQYALNYLYSILPRNMKAVIDAHAKESGQSNLKIIESLVRANVSTGVTLTFEGTTTKSSDGTGKKSTVGSSGIDLDAATALIFGKGYLNDVLLNPGSSYAVNVHARHSIFQKHGGENLGTGSTMLDASKSTLSGVLDWDRATFGGSRMNELAFNHVILNNGEVLGIDLPIDSNGNPDFSLSKKLEQLDDLVLKTQATTPEQINALCQLVGLPIKYSGKGELNPYGWQRFAAFQVVTDDSVLKDDINKDLVQEAVKTDRELYEAAIQKEEENYDLSDGFLFFSSGDKVYKGTVFIPIKQDAVAAVLSSNQTVSLEEATDIAMKLEGYDKDKIKTYKPAKSRADL